MKLHSLIFATAVALSFATSGARASEGDSHHNCGTGPFSGLYVGAHTGWVSPDSEQRETDTGLKVSSDDDAWSIGVHSGYNLQCGRFLLGVETDLDWTDAEASETILGQTTSVSYDYFGTLRVRGGIVHENWLAYVTGGAAFANIDRSLDAPIFGLSESDDDTEWGWTLGGGLEYACDKWIFRAEALYVDLDDQTINYRVSAPCIDCESNIRWEDDFVVARIGVSLKLHREEPVEPLK